MILNIILNETERKEKRKKKMKFEMKGDRDCPIAEIRLDGGESVKIETGAMAYMQNIELKGRVNSRKKGIGSMLGAIGRSVTSGESLFVTHAYATGPDAFIGVAPAITGTIHRLECGECQYRIKMMKKRRKEKPYTAGRELSSRNMPMTDLQNVACMCKKNRQKPAFLIFKKTAFSPQKQFIL